MRATIGFVGRALLGTLLLFAAGCATANSQYGNAVAVVNISDQAIPAMLQSVQELLKVTSNPVLADLRDRLGRGETKVPQDAEAELRRCAEDANASVRDPARAALAAMNR